MYGPSHAAGVKVHFTFSVAKAKAIIFFFPSMYIVGQALSTLNEHGGEYHMCWSIDLVSLFAFVDLAETKHENTKKCKLLKY